MSMLVLAALPALELATGDHGAQSAMSESAAAPRGHALAGETVRLFIVNRGKVPHEMAIGMANEIEEHAAMMK